MRAAHRIPSIVGNRFKFRLTKTSPHIATMTAGDITNQATGVDRDNNNNDAASLINTVPHAAVPPAAQQQPFRFMDLIPELREKVYEMAMPSPIMGAKIQVARVNSAAAKPKRYAVAQVCRQMRQEALAVYFSKTTFNICVSNHGTTAAHAWLASQDEVAVSCMRKIDICRSAIVNGEYHFAKICVDMVKETVAVDRDSHMCDKCFKEDAVAKIIQQVQDVIDGIERVDGRKRLTKSALETMIWRAKGMCMPQT